MTRLPDWQVRLTAYLARVRALPFAWGRHDCALFVAGAVEAMTGHDPAAGFRGRYRTASGARRVLRRAGHADHLALVAAHLHEIPPGLATPGDVVVVDDAALGICQGRFAYVVTETGVGLRPMEDVRRAFRVGE